MDKYEYLIYWTEKLCQVLHEQGLDHMGALEQVEVALGEIKDQSLTAAWFKASGLAAEEIEKSRI